MKRTLKTVATVALAGFVVASCSSLNKMKRLEKNIAYKVTPEMLEAKGGQVDLKIDATIPAKYFNKKVTLVATPVLKFQNGGEKAYEPKTFQGEKVQGNNEVVPYATEKTVNYSGTVPFEEGMRVSGLYVKFQGSKGKKSADYESRKIADGVIATATMVNNAPAIAIGADQFERITKEEQEAAIYYLINSILQPLFFYNNPFDHLAIFYYGNFIAVTSYSLFAVSINCHKKIPPMLSTSIL